MLAGIPHVLLHWLMPAFVVLFSSVGHGADPPALSPCDELHFALNAASTAIVSPQAHSYQVTAIRLAQGLESSTGHRPLIVTDTASPGELGAGPIIVLGNLMDSRLARSLYLQAYDFTDAAWPGAGGFVVRTIRDPFGSGAHVVFLGGSDADGVAKAAAQFLFFVRENGPEMGYVNRVGLGKLSDVIHSYTSELITDKEGVWLRSGMSGSWEYMAQIAQTGMGYLRTGDEAYLPIFKRELRYFFDHNVYHPPGNAPPQIHGFINMLIITWDLIRDHPSFTQAERRRFDNDFLFLLRSSEGPGRLSGAIKKNVVRNNHGTRTGLDAFFAGRYFSRRFKLAEADEWLGIAERYFSSQMISAKPVCDSWGHQWSASLYNTLVYSMAAGKDAYLQSEPLRLAADRALISHHNTEAPFGYLSACAVATTDTGYLSPWAGGKDVVQLATDMTNHGDEYLRSFCTATPVEKRDDLVGVVFAPVDPLWRNTIDETGFNPGGVFVTTVEPTETFDKISLREGWSDDDFYVLFDGISGGHHSYQDGNCIVRYFDKGLSWLGTATRFYGSSSVRSQNGVFAALNGAGPGRIHRYARLLYAAQQDDYLAAAGTLEGVGDIDWQRHILRKRGQWTLVIDRVVPKQAGEILAERHWYVQGTVMERPNRVVAEQVRDRQRWYLHLQSAGMPTEGVSGIQNRREIVRAQATPGKGLELGTLLYVNASADKQDARLTRTRTGWRIDSATGTEVAVVGPDGQPGITVLTKERTVTIGETPAATMPSFDKSVEAKTALSLELLPLHPSAPPTELDWRSIPVGQEPLTAVAMAADGRAAAGDEGGHVVVFSPTGQKVTETKLPSPILALHFLGEDLVIGEDRGALTRLAPDGTQRWQVVIPYVPMAWPYWSEYKSRLREITSADIDGDSKEEILISNSDRRVYAFSGEGVEIWKASVEWGVYTAMTVGPFGSQVGLYGGTSKPSIHGWCIIYGLDGKIRKHYSRLDLQSWSIPSQFRDMRLADLDANGQVETINAVDTNCRQLVVYTPDGKVRWDADVAGAAEAIAVRPGSTNDSVSVVYCCSAAGYVSAFDGRTGSRQWVCFIGEAAPFVETCEPYGILAIGPSGNAFLIDDQGRLCGHQDFNVSITAFLRPGDHRNAGSIAVGTEDGRLLTLPRAQ